MSRKTYVGALEAVLTPMGFARRVKDYSPHEPEWTRMVGTIEDCVDLQRSMYRGSTCNLWTKDTALGALVRSAIPWEPYGGLWQTGYRIGDLLGGGVGDRWWKNDPNGPDELAAAVRDHAETYFARYRTIEDQAARYGRFGEGRRGPDDTILLALTLYRMGEYEEALRAFENRPRLTPEIWNRRLDSVQAWLQARRDEIR